jgi:glutamate N-acetyltransferase/amino-acid N-acetyltransferase
VERTFNRTTVDSDTSTSDTVLLFATGQAKHPPVGGAVPAAFANALEEVLMDLALQVVRDGEGAQKLVRIAVTGAASDISAKRIGMAVANSPLVKTAIAGSDPNWGRILSAAGYAGVQFSPSDINIELQKVVVCKAGLAADYDEPELKKKLDEKEVRIRIVNQKNGKGEARFFTCDLTEGYIQINGSYRT